MHLIMHCLAGHASLPVHSLAYHNITFDSSKRQVSSACQGFDIVLKLQQQLTCLVFTITAFPMKGFSHNSVTHLRSYEPYAKLGARVDLQVRKLVRARARQTQPINAEKAELPPAMPSQR